MNFKKVFLFILAVLILSSYQIAQSVNLDESIKHDIPALPRQGEMHKSQENIKYNKPIRPDEKKKGHKKSETVIAKSKHKIKVVNDVLVTAYFGPTKDMKNYKGLVKMNGDGMISVSKKSVGDSKIGDSEEPADIGCIASDHGVFPKGTEIYVPGYGWGTVKDTGGAIRGKHIDLFFGWGKEAYEKALDWGAPRLQVIIVAEK